MISLHSHSGQFCRHAKGTLEECVLKAIELGFKVFGMSEHMPRNRLKDLYPEEVESLLWRDLTIEDLHEIFGDYTKEARRLQEKYKDKIILLVGMETENIHPTYSEDSSKPQTEILGSLDQVQNLRKQYNLDYVVGSVHHVCEHWVDFDFDRFLILEQSLGSLDSVFEHYFDAQYEMLRFLKPEIVGHFDLIRMYKPHHSLNKAVWSKILRNIDFIVEYGGLIELNSRAWKKGLNHAYPFPDILKVMLEKGCRFTMSDDSHGPQDIAMKYENLKEYMNSHNITKVYYPCRSGFIEIGI